MAITTNREYLTVMLSRFGLTADDVDLIIADNTELAEGLDVAACKMALYKSLSVILNGNISEGGYSLSWDTDRLKMWYNSLCREIGKPSAIQPFVRDRSNLW